ncbi:glycosyltransferase family 2 protein [Cellulosimicrobium cellulans]
MSATTLPRVVVVVPAHDEAAALPTTLASVRAQTRPADRVVVVSDRSTDGTVEVARRLGAEVVETVGNTGRKAGALNQALREVEAENVLVLDADTTIAPTFVEDGLALLDARPELGAVGGVFRGTPPRSVLEQLQSDEYERYGVQIDVTGRTSVLTGTAALVRTEVLRAVAAARGDRLPGRRGDVYDVGAITEDSELTLALRTLGYELASPVRMSCTTELMPTCRDLHRQRVRWYKGMLDNLRAYGFTRVTARYVGQQAMLVLSTLMLASLLVLTALTVVAGTFRVVPAWLAVGGVLVLERLVTVWRNGPRGRLLAVLVLPELLYDLFLQVAFVRACFLAATSRDAGWNHVAHTGTSGGAAEHAPETGPASASEHTPSSKQLTLT